VCNFKDYLQQLNKASGMDFTLINEDGSIWFDSLEGMEESGFFETFLILGSQKSKLRVKKEFEICASLLKYSIESKYKEIFSKREQFIIEILEGKSVSSTDIYKTIPFLNHKCSLFLISLDDCKQEALTLIKEYYDNEDVITMMYKQYILVIGRLEDISEHAESMKEVIVSNIYCKCLVSYSTFQGTEEELKKAFIDVSTCIDIGNKYNLKNSVYNVEDLLFEKIVYNISDDIKEELYEKFKKKFNKFDSEVVLTIEEFMNCGLNISEAAKKLYIHRNTLIYRLDKLQKDSGYDLRDFKQATIFTMAFLIWKEKRVYED
jgi:sugar diacid utilization regulator